MNSQKQNMTSRERWLAFMKCEKIDSLPFWAKISPTYLDTRKAKGDYTDKTIPGSPWQYVDDCITHQKQLWHCEYNDDIRREVFTVPSGKLELVYRFDPVSASYYPEKHAISSREDILIMTEYFTKVKPSLDPERLKNSINLIENTVNKKEKITSTCSGASPFLYYVVHLAGIENAHILLYEYPDEVQALLDATLNYMTARLKLHLEILRPDICLLIENMSTMLVSPNQFHKLVLPHIKIMNNLCNEYKGFLALQMPGHISGILDELASLKTIIVEGICSPPVGDTSLSLVRKKCPDIRVAGGTNAALWLESSEKLIEQLQKDLDSMPHHRGVAVTSSDMIPPDTPLKTVFEVAEFVENYKVKL